MQIHGPARVHGAQPLSAPHPARAASPGAQSPVSGADQLDISQPTDFVEQVKQLPEIRAERVEQIRAEMEAGVYETDDKLDAALERLLDEIG